jgi:ATP-dependent Clp protease adaptor protein ClpS
MIPGVRMRQQPQPNLTERITHRPRFSGRCLWDRFAQRCCSPLLQSSDFKHRRNRSAKIATERLNAHRHYWSADFAAWRADMAPHIPSRGLQKRLSRHRIQQTDQVASTQLQAIDMAPSAAVALAGDRCLLYLSMSAQRPGSACGRANTSVGNKSTMTDTTIKSNTDTELKVERPPLHKVILVNDDYTPREFVVMVLKAEFRISEEQAHRVMVTAHQRGVCVVAVYTKDVAEARATNATDLGRSQGYPLLFTTEPEE